MTMKKTPTKDSVQSDSSDEGDENKARGNWSSQVDFTLSCIGYAVGLGNLWRFPYLCMRNGGGAFLIPYFTFMFLCGLPLFFMELSLGQFSSLSPLSVWKICPIFKGVGWGMLVVSTICCIYYNIIITWVLYYLGMSFASDVPWKTCDNEWNTPNCSRIGVTWTLNETASNGSVGVTAGSRDWAASTTVSDAISAVAMGNATDAIKFSPAEEFWTRKVLELTDGIHDLGGIKWELLLCLVAAWIIVFLCLIRGVKSSGKVVYVTATVPYVFLTILLVRGLTLPGSLEGIKYYVIPDFKRLLEFKVWAEACLQIFYSLGPAWGGLITMASYNRFHNNCLRDSIIVCVSCSGTSFFAGFVIFSVIGFMAKEANLSVADVITQGPGLAFVAYPEAIAKLPISPFWAICFFLMLLSLGLDSQFSMLETVTSGFVDEFPRHLKKRKMLFTAVACLGLFIVGLPLATRGGMYVFQIIDWYSASFSVMVIGLCECIVMAYIYGIKRMFYDMETMLGSRPSYIWAVLIGGVTPLLLVIILVFTAVRMSPPTYGDYIYPQWAIALGWGIAMCSIIPIPMYAIYAIFKTRGTLRQRLDQLFRPAPDWGPALAKHRASYKYALPPAYADASNGLTNSHVTSMIYNPNAEEEKVALNSYNSA